MRFSSTYSRFVSSISFSHSQATYELLRVTFVVGASFAAVPFYRQMRAMQGNSESDIPLDALVYYVDL
jgi:cytochrome c oxidase assembly protein Cox11